MQAARHQRVLLNTLSPKIFFLGLYSVFRSVKVRQGSNNYLPI